MEACCWLGHCNERLVRLESIHEKVVLLQKVLPGEKKSVPGSTPEEGGEVEALAGLALNALTAPLLVHIADARYTSSVSCGMGQNLLAGC